MTEKEKSLIASCLKGEKTSWDAFVLQYSALVYHTIRKTLTLHHNESRDEVVADLYQEFFVSLLQDGCRKLRQFRGDHGCSLASWLRVVASRLTIDFLRRKEPSQIEVTDGMARDNPDPVDALFNESQEEGGSPKPFRHSPLGIA
jgi:RNA polymerase sigma factor (sigma-70 family)